jgi:hypothetical protein
MTLMTVYDMLHPTPSVMPGLVPGIHVFPSLRQDVDGRNKSGHDE